MKSIEEIKAQLQAHRTEAGRMNEEHECYLPEHPVHLLEWVLQDSLDGEKILDTFFRDNEKGEKTEVLVKRKDICCYLCYQYPDCQHQDDITIAADDVCILQGITSMEDSL